MHRRPIPAASVCLGAALLLAGCWGQTPTNTDPTCSVVSLSVSPATVNLVLGGATPTVTASLVTSGCTTSPAIIWSSSSATAVAISGSGTSVTLTATAASATPVTITASAGGQSGTLQVTIVSEPAIGLSATAVTMSASLGGTTNASRIVTISNTGGGALTGLAVGSIAYGAGASGWLQASLSGITATPTANLTLQATVGALVEGTYTASVSITATGATNSPKVLAVTFVVRDASANVQMLVFERWTGTTYPSATGEIWRMDPDGQNQIQLTNNSIFDGYPALSPDRSKISFATNRAGNIDLYLMDADGNGQVGVRFTTSPEVGSSWSPDGLRLVYEFIFSSTDVDLQLLTLGNLTETALVDSPQSEENPNWSPDGLEVAFAKDPLGTLAYKIYRAPVAGGTPTQLTTGPSDDFAPAWSPDGTKIAFSSNRVGGTYNIFVMDAATGGNIVQLTTTGFNYGATWSPDGTRIAFASSQNNDWDIWVMKADGTGKVNITATPGTNEVAPSWR